MSKMLFTFLSLVGLLTVGLGALSAQEPAPTENDVTLRPGDKITWTPTSPHRLQFGGTVTVNGTPVKLTAFSDIEKIFKDFNPPLSANSQGVAVAQAGAKVTAIVRDDAATSGVSSFFFTCGFTPHTPQMVTVNFKIAPASGGHPARDIQIISENNPVRWVLKPDPSNKKLTRP